MISVKYFIFYFVAIPITSSVTGLSWDALLSRDQQLVHFIMSIKSFLS